MKISEIKIGDRFRKNLGNVDQLIQSIQEIGLLHPVVINENDELVAGQRRLEAFRQLGRQDIPVTRIILSDIDIVNGEVHENTVRKDFTISERYEIRQALEPLEKQKAEERMKAGKQPSGNFPKGRALDNIAKVFGISGKTLEKEKVVVEAAQQKPEQFGNLPDKIDKGMSVEHALSMVERANDHKNTPALPEGEFDIILADPPWSYEFVLRGSGANHYPVMTDEEIENLKIPAAEDAILFLWATQPKIQEALNVVKAWGFNYRTGFVWVKDKIGNGSYNRAQHELLLIGRKGDIPTPEEINRPSSIIEAPRTKEHSEKPDIVYQIIEQMYPNRKYLELFARKEKEGWTSWGNELEEREFMLTND